MVFSFLYLLLFPALPKLIQNGEHTIYVIFRRLDKPCLTWRNYNFRFPRFCFPFCHVQGSSTLPRLQKCLKLYHGSLSVTIQICDPCREIVSNHRSLKMFWRQISQFAFHRLGGKQVDREESACQRADQSGSPRRQ